eukprot:8402442-Pyramimonas_sp.AAC.1
MSAALGNLDAAVLRQRGAENKNRLRKPAGTAAKSYCIALFASLFHVLPFLTTAIWQPSQVDLPGPSTV